MSHVFNYRLVGKVLVVALLAALAGCGGSDFGTVTGAVTLDGKPLDGGSVTFYPANTGALSYGEVSPEGKYELRTASRDGVLPGPYIATISYRSGRAGPGMTIQQIEALEKVPIKYCQKETSDLRFDITPGHNEVNLHLVSEK
jgi:hypothetical protein